MKHSKEIEPMRVLLTAFLLVLILLIAAPSSATPPSYDVTYCGPVTYMVLDCVDVSIWAPVVFAQQPDPDMQAIMDGFLLSGAAERHIVPAYRRDPSKPDIVTPWWSPEEGEEWARCRVWALDDPAVSYADEPWCGPAASVLAYGPGFPNHVLWAEPTPNIPPAVGDVDIDGVPDAVDNCTLDPNGPTWPGGCNAQEDGDSDGYGNACDTDFNDDSGTDVGDLLAMYFEVLSVSTDPEFDLDCDGAAGLDDLGVTEVDAINTAVPGPSGLACAGTSCP